MLNKYLKTHLSFCSYKQRKFNLFREESEGYSKLIVELNQERQDNEVASTLEIVKSLIGTNFSSDIFLTIEYCLFLLLKHFIISIMQIKRSRWKYV